MLFYELKCTAYLKNNISFEKSFEIISKYISFSMCQDTQTAKVHNDFKAYNHYCFGGFSPREEAKLYKKGNIYTFDIRSIDEALIDTLALFLLRNTNNPHLIIVDVHKHTQKQYFITELYTVTPTIISSNQDANGKPIYWTALGDGDIMKLQTQLHNNLLGKYHAFYGQALSNDTGFIQYIELKNQKPQSIKLTSKHGKPYSLFGNKFKIIPNEDETSQKLAFLALGVGLGEKSSFGAGFVIGKGMR